MIFHEKTWGQDGDQVGTKLSAETLRAIWFGDISAPKPYAQYDLGNQRRRNLTHNMIWGTRGAETLRTVWFGTQRRRRPMSFWHMASLLNLSHDILMVCASFTHGFRMVRSRFVPSPTFPSQAHLILLASSKKHINILVNSLWSTLHCNSFAGP